ncbi:hypothetical protein ILYODFUR_022412 [Ilyodon furcidens]|uniref:Uncharacterized protein n=1 Tax=Ilyodon furcidens TaxID=33524 RepID=A0ABV0TWT7_9TELE
MKTEKERALLLAGLNLLMNSAGRVCKSEGIRSPGTMRAQIYAMQQTGPAGLGETGRQEKVAREQLSHYSRLFFLTGHSEKNPLQLIFDKSSRSFFPSFLLCRFF